MGELAKRVDALERRNCWLTRTVILMGLALVGMLTLGWTSPDGAVQAQKFEVVDANGKARAALYLDKDGSPVLVLRDANDRSRAALNLSKNGSPRLDLGDAIGKGGMSLTVNDDGSPFLALYDAHDPSSKQRVGMPRAGLPLLDGDYSRVSLFLDKEGSPYFALHDADGELRARLSLDKAGTPFFGLAAANGQFTWRAPTK